MAATAEMFDRAVAIVEADERLDALVGVHDVAARVARSPVGPFLRGRPLGHALHPLMTDVPIGCWTSAALLDLFGGSHGRVAARRLIGFGVLSALPTAVTGLAELGTVDPDDRATSRVATVHAGLNTVALLAYARSWSSRRKERQVRGMLWSLAGAGVASAAGHLGGHLAFARGIGHGRRADEALGPIDQSSVGGAGVGGAGVGGAGVGGERVGGAGVGGAGVGDVGVGDVGADGETDDPVVVGIDAAAAILGVPASNVQVMIDDGLVEPLGGSPTSFRRTDLEFVRLLGG